MITNLISLFLLLSLSILSGASQTNNQSWIPPQFYLVWNPSPSSNVTYNIYGLRETLSVTNTIAYSGITNTNIAVYGALNGRWSFVATAKSGGIESLPSNTLILNVPAEPSGVNYVAVTTAIDVNGPFTTNLFIRLVPVNQIPQ